MYVSEIYGFISIFYNLITAKQSGKAHFVTYFWGFVYYGRGLVFYIKFIEFGEYVGGRMLINGAMNGAMLALF